MKAGLCRRGAQTPETDHSGSNPTSDFYELRDPGQVTLPLCFIASSSLKYKNVTP